MRLLKSIVYMTPSGSPSAVPSSMDPRMMNTSPLPWGSARMLCMEILCESLSSSQHRPRSRLNWTTSVGPSEDILPMTMRPPLLPNS